MDLTGNKDLLQSVFDSAPNGIAVMEFVHDKSGKVIDFAILLFNAYTHNWIGNIEYQGKRYSALFPTVKETGVLKKFIDVAETGVPAKFETYYDGEGMQHWFRFTVVRQGQLLVVTTEDITEQKHYEMALKTALDVAEKQKRLYDSILNTTPDLIYVFDLNYNFIYANNALLNMWGKTAEQAIGKGLRENGYEEWHALMHEREIDDAVSGKKTIRGTVSFPHAELGLRIYDYIFGPVFNRDGEVEAIAGTTRDITEQALASTAIEESEAKLKSVIDQTPAPTLVLRGDDLVIAQANKSMLGLIGFGEEVIGMPILTLLPELANQYIWGQVLKVQTEGIPFDQWEVLVSHKRTGEMKDYYYNLAYRPLRENGKITGMIQVAIDVTMQVEARLRAEESENRYKQLSETLEQLVSERTSELQRSNADLQQFAHVASHDLKEPVRKITTFLMRLEERLADKLDEQSKHYIERMQVAANRMNTMIEGVLSYSTINASVENLQLVDLNEIIRTIETDLELSLQETRATIEYSNLPKLEGAPVLLYQLFYNLINNSIKFVKPGIPSKITIKSEPYAEEGESFALIRFSDNGIGFDQGKAEHIFDTFTRLNSKDKFEGTGLGLSLCKKIAQRHGGSISATGVPGQGATFTIMLPFKQD